MLVPTGSLSVRGSWAKQFRPPNIPQLVENRNFSQILALPDAQSPSGTTAALIESGKRLAAEAGALDELVRRYRIQATHTPRLASEPDLFPH